MLFVPVGNPAPDFYREVRPGTNLYTGSIVALDVKTGKLLWYHQFFANDMHDWDLSEVSPIFRAPVNGKERNLLTATGKDGLLRMVDRDNRELLYELARPAKMPQRSLPFQAFTSVLDCLAGWNGTGQRTIPKVTLCSWRVSMVRNLQAAG